MIFALLTHGMNATQREEMWDQLCQPLNAEQINKGLQRWKREVLGDAS